MRAMRTDQGWTPSGTGLPSGMMPSGPQVRVSRWAVSTHHWPPAVRWGVSPFLTSRARWQSAAFAWSVIWIGGGDWTAWLGGSASRRVRAVWMALADLRSLSRMARFRRKLRSERYWVRARDWVAS